MDLNVQDVIDILKNLNIQKSPGPDAIHPAVLKECRDELANPLYNLFQASLVTGKIPFDWKTGHISPIFKKGDQTLAENYRPISLTSVVCKCMEKIVRSALLKHIIGKNILTDKQHGFVPGRSCSTQLLEVMDQWTEIMDNGGTVDIIYLDFAKAFDTVPHQRLLQKLEYLGIKGKVLKWIEAFLSQRKQRVCICIGNALSSWSNVSSGVPQGSVLGPVLFLYYVNDLPARVNTSMIHMYADDTKLSKRIDGIHDCFDLQESLDSVKIWSDNWQLKLNLKKCKVLHLGRSQKYADYTLLENGVRNKVEESQGEKDIGVWINGDLKFVDHTDKAVAKARKILGLIKRTFKCRDPGTMKLLFTALVRPHLEHCNVVWHPMNKRETDKLERVQRMATKLVPGFQDLSYQQRMNRLKIPSLAYRRLRGDVIEVYKYLHDFYAVNASSMFRLRRHNAPATRGHCLKLEKKCCNTRLRQHFFSNRIVNVWNSLPVNVVTAPSLNSFKGRFDAVNRHQHFIIEEKELYDCLI